MQPVSTLGRLSPRAAWLCAAMIVAASVALIAHTVWLMDRGFDFTDQAFYLMFMQRPAAYRLNYGLWAYGLKPLYELAGGSVAGLRRLCALVLTGFGFVAGLAVLNRAQLSWQRPAGIQILAACAALPLSYYALWIPTPSYNWFALLGGLALFVAILLLRSPDGAKASAVWAGVAGILAAFARPHNAAGYGVLYLAAVLIAFPMARARMTQLAWAAAATALGALALTLLLPIGVIVNQVREYYAIFGTSHPVDFSFPGQQFDFLLRARAYLLAPALSARLYSCGAAKGAFRERWRRGSPGSHLQSCLPCFRARTWSIQAYRPARSHFPR